MEKTKRLSALLSLLINVVTDGTTHRLINFWMTFLSFKRTEEIEMQQWVNFIACNRLLSRK